MDAKILALTTKVGQLKKALAEKPVAATTTDKQSKTGREIFPGLSFAVEKWRAKKEGDTKVVDGKTYHWCPHHKNEGRWDGLYVTTHTADTHFTWRKNRRGANGGGASNGGASNGNGSNGGSAGADASTKLQVTDKLRSSLSTKLMLNDKDIDAICKEVGKEN